MNDDDLKDIARSIRALAVAARKLEAHRNQGGMIANGTAMGSVAQLATSARDFARAVDTAFEALSPELRKLVHQ